MLLERLLSPGKLGSQTGRLRRGQRRRPPTTSTKRRPLSVPWLEELECRTVPSTLLTVHNNLDSGAGSLRDAIANAQSGDSIAFDQSLFDQTITLTK